MKKILKIWSIILIIAILMCDTKIYAYDGEELTEDDIREVISTAAQLQILSKAALVYDRTYGKILYEKNIDEKLPNASTTKILTAIVAYENANMDDMVTVSQKAAGTGGSTINLRKGNKVLLGDLMKGLLICSGNDAAVAIAEHVGGSVEEFCNMMNQKARELGANDTNFLTPHGLDKEGHYTTARNLMIFADYLLNISYLAEIVNMQTATIKIDDYTKSLRTTNEMLGIYENADGLKTGFTNKAGRCLVTSITQDGRQLITIVLGCDTKKQRTKETIQLINYGYSEYEVVDIYEKMRKNIEISIEKTAVKEYEISISGKKMMLLEKNKNGNLTYKYNINKKLVAPIEKGEKIGEIEVYLETTLINVIEIRVPVEIKRKTVVEYFFEILDGQKQYIQLKV